MEIFLCRSGVMLFPLIFAFGLLSGCVALCYSLARVFGPRDLTCAACGHGVLIP